MSKSQGFSDLLENSRINPAIISVTALMFQIFLLAHIIACFWFFITTSEATGGPTNDDINAIGIRTWATEFQMQSEDAATQYITSLYFTFYTLLSIGYGDIHPTNTQERFFALVVMLIGGLMFGAIIAKVRGE